MSAQTLISHGCFLLFILHKGGNTSFIHPNFHLDVSNCGTFPLNTAQEVTVGAGNVTALPLQLIQGADIGNIPVGLLLLFGREQQNITEQQQKYIQ